MIRIALVSPLIFKETNGNLREAIIIAATQPQKELAICSSWPLLDNKAVHFHDAPSNNLNIIDALTQERNLSLRRKDDFYHTVSGDILGEAYEISTHLVVDQHLNFLVLFECAIKCDEVDLIDAILSILLKERNPIQELKQESFAEKVVQHAISIITEELKKYFSNSHRLENSYCFTIDSSYPIVFIDSKEIIDCVKYLKNEENIVQRSASSLIASEYKNAYLHLGWNYSFSQNLPENINNSIFSMMVRLQLYYYQMVFFKKYFQNKITLLMANKRIGNSDVQNFDDLQMAYNRMRLDYKTYKSGLYPKLYCEFEEVEKLWHLDKDDEIINEIFILQKEFIEKKYKIKIEKIAARQSFALNFLAVINVFGIFGLWLNFDEMKVKFHSDFSASIIVTLVSLVLVLPFILWPLITRVIEALQKGND